MSQIHSSQIQLGPHCRRNQNEKRAPNLMKNNTMAVNLASLRHKLKPVSFCKIKSVQRKKADARHRIETRDKKKTSGSTLPPSPELFCSVSNMPPERVSNMWFVKTFFRECVEAHLRPRHIFSPQSKTSMICRIKV